MKDLILKYALKNALDYNGKANLQSVLGKVLQEKPELKNNIKELAKEINEIIKKVNSMGKEQQEKEILKFEFEEKREEKKELQELQNPRNKMVFRLAPYPSGALHLGNAKTYLLNALYAEKYHGKILLVFDDTIGSKEKQLVPEAYKLIKEGFDWLKVKYEKIYYKSSRLKIYYKYAEEIIKKGKAYVCSCSQEKLKENRLNQKECLCRGFPSKIQLKKWKEMFHAKEGDFTLRIKTDMQHPNPAFRDRVIFKISNRKHPRVGKKYLVWPLLEFSWAIDDHLLGITHIIRGKDLMMESEMEKYIWDIFDWKHPELIHAGMMKVEGAKISKSKAQNEVKSGKYIGWDDPRTWSIQSLRRRGIRAEAIREFVKEIGLNENDITVPIENLYSINRKLIDKKTRRYFAVFNPKKIKILNAPQLKIKAPVHPEFNYGYRNFNTGNEFYIQDKLEEDKNYRFMHLFNFKNNKFISQEFEKELEAKMIHWLPVNKDLVNIDVLMEDGKIVKGLGEKDLKKVKINEIVQFERNFFARLDKKSKNKLVFWFTHK